MKMKNDKIITAQKKVIYTNNIPSPIPVLGVLPKCLYAFSVASLPRAVRIFASVGSLSQPQWAPRSGLLTSRQNLKSFAFINVPACRKPGQAYSG